MFSLREALIKEFIKIIKNPNFDEIFHLLSLGGYTLEVSYSTGITEFIEQEWDEIPFGFIYNKSYFEERAKYFEMRKMAKKPLPLAPKEIAQDISNISKKMEVLYSMGLFDYLQKILARWRKEFNSQNIIRDDGILSSSPYVNLRVKGIQVLGIDYEEHEDMDMGIVLIEEILKQLPINVKIIPLSDESWFSILTNDCQLLINAGEKLIEIIKFEENKEDIIDFSPLLLDFIKALEVEIVDHYKIHQNKIYNLANQIKKHHGIHNGNNRDKINKLLRIVSGILRYKENYRPNGLSPLYYFLKYFALGEDLDLNQPFRSYLDNTKFEYLRKQRNVIERLERLGVDRNDYFHEKFIESIDEFKAIYIYISLSLKILAEIK